MKQNDYIFECGQCTKQTGVEISLIVPAGQIHTKYPMVLKFLRRHYFCGDSQQYKDVLSKIKSQNVKKMAKMALSLHDTGIPFEDAIEMAKETLACSDIV